MQIAKYELLEKSYGLLLGKNLSLLQSTRTTDQNNKRRLSCKRTKSRLNMFFCRNKIEWQYVFISISFQSTRSFIVYCVNVTISYKNALVPSFIKQMLSFDKICLHTFRHIVWHFTWTWYMYSWIVIKRIV